MKNFQSLVPTFRCFEHIEVEVKEIDQQFILVQVYIKNITYSPLFVLSDSSWLLTISILRAQLTVSTRISRDRFLAL